MKLPRNGRMINGVITASESIVPYRPRNSNSDFVLPTPTASQYGSNQGGASGRTGKVRHSLDSLAKIGRLTLPTPTTFDASSRPLPPRKKNPSGGQKPGLLSVIGGKLNPQFVEWMMQYPTDWTKVMIEIPPHKNEPKKKRDNKELNNLEMQSFQESQELSEDKSYITNDLLTLEEALEAL